MESQIVMDEQFKYENVKKSLIGLFSMKELETLKQSNATKCPNCDEIRPLAKVCCCDQPLCRHCVDELYDNYVDCRKDGNTLFKCTMCDKLCNDIKYEY